MSAQPRQKSPRHSLPSHYKMYSISQLRRLLRNADSGDPQEELEDDVMEAIIDQIGWLEHQSEKFGGFSRCD